MLKQKERCYNDIKSQFVRRESLPGIAEMDVEIYIYEFNSRDAECSNRKKDA